LGKLQMMRISGASAADQAGPPWPPTSHAGGRECVGVLAIPKHFCPRQRLGAACDCGPDGAPIVWLGFEVQFAALVAMLASRAAKASSMQRASAAANFVLL